MSAAIPPADAPDSAAIIPRSASMARSFLTAQWRWLTAVNFEVDPALLERYIPRGTRLDFFQGRTFISLLGFQFLKTRLLGIPIPFHCNFDEVNLRFYVVRETPTEIRRGVVFIKELVTRWAVAKVARWAYHENYESLPMRHERVGVPAHDVTRQPCDPDARVGYRWKRAGAWYELSLDVRGTAQPLPANSEPEFIAEHYFGYTRRRDNRSIEYQVTHPSWHAWLDCTPKINCDFERFYPRELVETLHGTPSSAFLMDGSAISVAFPKFVG